MYDANASFSADIVDQGHFQFIVQQTGLDTADLDVRSWPIGSDYSQPPQSEHSLNLTGCRSLGNKITCSAKVAWILTDSIEIDISPAGVAPSIKVAVSGVGGFAELAPVSQSDHDAVVVFQATAAFPAG